MRKIHLDTDLGGDIDDLCALALLLRWPGGVEITGITTVAEAAGRRAGYVRHALALAGREEIPIAAGADVAGGHYRYAELGYPDEGRYWSMTVPPLPGAPDAALNSLAASIEQGAAVVAIGPYTNLSLLEDRHPGILMQAELTLMGGHVYPIRAGYPQWGNEDDWNIQVDVASARHVLQRSRPSLVPLTVTVETALRRAHLDRLRAAGALGRLIARQAEAFAEDEQMSTRYGETCDGLPRDIVNFQHDALACAIALGWRDGVTVEQQRLCVEERDGWLVERIDELGLPVHIATSIVGPRFNEFWLDQVAGASANP